MKIKKKDWKVIKTSIIISVIIFIIIISISSFINFSKTLKPTQSHLSQDIKKSNSIDINSSTEVQDFINDINFSFWIPITIGTIFFIFMIRNFFRSIDM